MMLIPSHAGPSLDGSHADPHLGPLPEWNLADLYAGLDDEAFARDLARGELDAEAFSARWKGRVVAIASGAAAGARLAEAVRALEVLDDLLGRVMAYAGLSYSSDTSDPVRTKFYGDAQERVTAASSHLLFFALELNRVPEKVMEEALRDPALTRWRPWIEDLRKERPHQLEDRLEQVLHEKSLTSRAAWNRLFDETMTALRFEVEGRSLTLEPTLNLLQDSNEATRHAASDELARVLGANLRTFGLITNTLAKDLEITDRWRGFTDVASSRNLANRVEDEVVAALVSAVEDAFPRLSHRYYALKARWFGKPQLESYDRNAPLPAADPRLFPWDEARETVLSAYAGFSPRMAGIASRFFDERWIDAPVRPGKAPGAFAHPTVPSAHPFVLVNYQGKSRDVMTLAHELGHGVHQVLAAHNGALMAPTPLTLAETASVFGEMLTFRALLARTTTKAARRQLLASKVEDMLNTVVRQIAFYLFERRVHEERRGGELTTTRIGEIWLDVQARSLGPAIRLGPGYETFWAYVPHFIHSPFYVYAYAFGDCLVNSLYGVYERAEEGFAERYLAMLAAGGTKHHSEVLAPFGLDARDPGFWQIGLGMIEGFIVELEAMDL